MDETKLMDADQVAECLKISKGTAYKVIRQLNNELKEQGFFVIIGRVNRDYLYKRIYETYIPEDKRDEK